MKAIKICAKSWSLIILTIFVVSIFSVMNVSAATSVSVDYLEGDPASITVTVDTDQPNRAAIVSVYSIYNEKKYWILLETSERTAENIFTYTNTLPSDMPSGTYTVNVSVGEDESDDTFTHYNLAAANRAIELLNDATKTTFSEVINNEAVYHNLAIDVNEFNSHSELVTQLFFLYKPLNPDSTPKELDITEFAALYKKCIELAKLKGETIETIASYLAQNSSVIDFDYEAFKSLADDKSPEKLTDEQKEIITRFSNAIYTEKDSDTQYSHWFCIASINSKVIDTTTVYKTALFETYKDILELSLTEYDKHNNKNDIIKKIMEDKYDSVQEIKDAFYKAVEETPTKEKESSRGSGGSSGRGSSGTSVGPIDWSNAKSEEKEGKTELFIDVEPTHWCAEPIKKLYELSIISGDGNGMFRPDSPVSRAEFVKMLVNALFADKKATVDAKFKDVFDSQWFANYVNVAAELEIVEGDENRNFMPQNTISRQDMATMLKRAIDKAGISISPAEKSFDDSENFADYAKDAISSLAGAGILNGMNNGNFEPMGELLRAQAVKALYEVMKICGRL